MSLNKSPRQDILVKQNAAFAVTGYNHISSSLPNQPLALRPYASVVLDDALRRLHVSQKPKRTAGPCCPFLSNGPWTSARQSAQLIVTSIGSCIRYNLLLLPVLQTLAKNRDSTYGSTSAAGLTNWIRNDWTFLTETERGVQLHHIHSLVNWVLSSSHKVAKWVHA